MQGSGARRCVHELVRDRREIVPRRLVHLVSLGGAEGSAVARAQPVEEHHDTGDVARCSRMANRTGQGRPCLVGRQTGVGNTDDNNELGRHREPADNAVSRRHQSPVHGGGGVVRVALQLRDDLEEAPIHGYVAARSQRRCCCSSGNRRAGAEPARSWNRVVDDEPHRSLAHGGDGGAHHEIPVLRPVPPALLFDPPLVGELRLAAATQLQGEGEGIEPWAQVAGRRRRGGGPDHHLHPLEGYGTAGRETTWIMSTARVLRAPPDVTPATGTLSGMDAVIRTSGLTKYYGETRGVEDLDLDVRLGEVFGFIGPNGAGKTTTLRLLLDLIRPTSGTAEVLGRDAHAESLAIRQRVGYLPGELAMFRAMTGNDLVRFFGALRSLDARRNAAGVAERLDLDLSRRVRDYSSGNRQKLALVQAFMHEPELLILDEPTNALDPLIQQEFYRMLDEVRADGRSVLISSHVLPEVERVADRVGIIRSGTLVAVESVADLKARAVRRIEFRFVTPLTDINPFARVPGVRSTAVLDDGLVAQVVVTGSVDAVLKAAAGYEVASLVSYDGDLEEAFLAYYQAAPDAT